LAALAPISCRLPAAWRGSTGAVTGRVLVLGVGNTLRGDDGAGYCLARALMECGGVEGADTRAVQMLNPGHFSLLEGYDFVVFVDAYVDPDMPPGRGVAVLELDPSRLSPEDVAEIVQNTDPHGMDPIRLLVFAYAAGVFRGRGVLIGVRPERIEFMKGLSGEVIERLVKALEALGSVLQSKGARLVVDPGCVAAWLRERCRSPLLE